VYFLHFLAFFIMLLKIAVGFFTLQKHN
jgi:hypothetical protein